jgi:hypothetical protein
MAHMTRRVPRIVDPRSHLAHLAEDRVAEPTSLIGRA